ncbi:MAG: cell division protein FtsZ, partial [Chloroflexota bacterium]
VIDPNLGDEMRITVIATGFERQGMPRRVAQPRGAQAHAPAAKSAQQPAQPGQPGQAANAPAEKNEAEFMPRVYNTEDLDIPAFLRRR